MPLSESAKLRLRGLWGAYDFYLIKDQHHLTASALVVSFLVNYQVRWSRSTNILDFEYEHHGEETLELLSAWATERLRKVYADRTEKTLQTSIMFKQLFYGHQLSLNFGSIGTNWKKKAEVEEELVRYRPWSVAHATAVLGGREALVKHMRQILAESCSPTEEQLFWKWWSLTEQDDRPMLFPQILGNTSGKFFHEPVLGKPRPLHFSFGLVNTEHKTKTLINCRSDWPAERRRLASFGGWAICAVPQQKHTLETVFEHSSTLMTEASYD